MGAGYVLGTDLDPTMTFRARVGGPLSSTRAEAANLLQLLLDVRQRYNHRVHLLIYLRRLPGRLGHPEKVGTGRFPSGAEGDSAFCSHPPAP